MVQRLEELAPSRRDSRWPSAAQNLRRAAGAEPTPGVLSASAGVGYQWADSPTMGACVIVATDGDPAAAQRHAAELAGWVWGRRADWIAPSVSVPDAIAAGRALGEFPVILADQGDNTGGGAPGDATHVLRHFLGHGFAAALVLYIVDPDAAAAAARAGVGARAALAVGGKSHERLGPPVAMEAEVLAVSDGAFTYDGPMWAGRHESVGPTAWLRQGGVEVVVISRPQQPVDLALCRSLGLDCTTKKWISVKSAGHFRSGFEPIAGGARSIFNVDGETILSHNYQQMAAGFSRLGRKVFPVDADASLAPESGARL